MGTAGQRRHRRRQDIYRLAGAPVLVAYGTVAITEALARAAAGPDAGQPLTVVGILRHPRSRCWCVGVARAGDPLTWVSAHRLLKTAETQIARIGQAVQHGDRRDATGWSRLLPALAAEGDPDLMPIPLSLHSQATWWEQAERAPEPGDG